MKNIVKISALLILLSVISACNSSSETELKPGLWRATLKTASGAEIPFNFEVTDSAGQKVLELINGKDRFRVNEITVNSDSILIQMPLFETEILAKIKNNALSGNWVKHMADTNMIMAFEARYDESWRFFKASPAPKAVISGRLLLHSFWGHLY